jgi:hypothetical protein
MGEWFVKRKMYDMEWKLIGFGYSICYGSPMNIDDRCSIKILNDIMSSPWTAEPSVAVRFNRPLSKYLILLKRHTVGFIVSQRLHFGGTMEGFALMLAYTK